MGCHPLTTTTENGQPRRKGLCQSLVLPVLLEPMRYFRCSFCFRPLDDSYHNPSSILLHRHCSQQCSKLDQHWEIETRAAQRLASLANTKKLPSPTVILCSRIVRLCRSNPAAKQEYNQLCWNVDLLSDEEKNTYLELMQKCHFFLRQMNDPDASKAAYALIHPDPTPAYQFMSRLTMNGFTISTSEQLPLGVGVYPDASMINHSCRPNAVPTFWFSNDAVSTPPLLQITTCRTVNEGDEITISYCDGSAPRSTRLSGLWKNYKFQCGCALCKDGGRDDCTVGLKCANKGCKGMALSERILGPQPAVAEEDARNTSTTSRNMPCFECELCGCVDFDDAIRAQTRCIHRIEQIELFSQNSTTSNNDSKSYGQELKTIYESLKSICNIQSSWYIAWSADALLNWCANNLSRCANEQEQIDICQQGLVVMNETRSATKFSMCYPGNLRWFVQRGVEAKLRLFVNPMDMEALGMLRDVREKLIMFYPSSDETVLLLEQSIAAYSFS